MSFTDDFRACLAQFIATDGTPLFNADRLASVRVSLAKPVAGNVLVYSATNDRYEPGPPAFVASTTAAASLNIPQGTAPSSPANGDVWMTTAGLFYRANGVTVGPLGKWSA